VFDERGYGIGAAGFRGWSGGARTDFFISAVEATPGYLPGPVDPGRWHVLLAPYHVAPAGLRYEIDAAAQVRALGGVAVAAHPFAPCLGCGFKHDPAHADAVEVWNGPWTLDDEVGLPQTVVLVDELSIAGLTAGLRAGRSWIAEPAGVELSFAAGTARAATPPAQVGIGGQVPAAEDAVVDVSLDVDDVADGVLVLVTDQGVVRRARCGTRAPTMTMRTPCRVRWRR